MTVPSPPEVAYAKHIAKPGEHLGLLDVGLLAAARHKDILLMYYDNEKIGPPVLRSLLDILRDVTDGVADFQGPCHPDPSQATTWVMAIMKGDFSRGAFSELNHFMPLYPRVQAGEDWDGLVEKLKTKHDGRMRRAQDAINANAEDSDEDLKKSAMDHLATLHLKKQFMEDVISAGFLPAIVPGDGDCALWSLQCVAAGCFLSMLMATKDKVMGMRQDLAGKLFFADLSTL